jgi:hypothetical protein
MRLFGSCAQGGVDAPDDLDFVKDRDDMQDVDHYIRNRRKRKSDIPD